MVLCQGILQIGTGGEGLVEEVAHGAVLAVDLLGGGVGRGVGAPRFGGAELLQGCWGDLPLAAPEHLVERQAADLRGERHKCLCTGCAVISGCRPTPRHPKLSNADLVVSAAHWALCRPLGQLKLIVRSHPP